MNKDWFTVTRIDEKTFAISELKHWEKVHSFLLIGDDKAILIDTGLGIGNIARVVRSLTDKEVIVLTTHVHTDHIGGHGLFSDIRVHEDDRAWLEHGIAGRSLVDIRNDLVRDVSEDDLPDTFNLNNYFPYTGKATNILIDGQVIDIGKRCIEVIHTPGHSPGHCCFVDKTNGYLFTGDLLYTTQPVYAFYPSTSPTDLCQSWLKISILKDINKVLPSHYTLILEPSILSDAGAAANELLTNKLDHFGTGVHNFGSFRVMF